MFQSEVKLRVAGIPLALVGSALIFSACGGPMVVEATVSQITEASSEKALAERLSAVRARSLVKRMRSKTAYAEFTVLDGCVETTAVPVASFSMERERGSTRVEETQLFLAIVQLDICTMTPLFDGDGPLANPTLDIPNDLRSAHTAGIVTVFDVVSSSNVNFNVDLTWRATGPVETTKEVDREVAGPGLIIKTHFATRRRPAVASGSISRNGVNYARAGSSFAEIADVRSGTMEIVRRW